MIQLHQFAPIWGLNLSPFCLKVETYLRLAEIPYQVVPTTPMKAPKGKLPFIIDDNGACIPDSGHIIAHLKHAYGDPLDDKLSPDQHALGHLIRRTCEESLMHVMAFGRWIDLPGWTVMQRTLAESLPKPLRVVLPAMIRRKIRKALYSQGYGRHDREEIYELGCADLNAIDRILEGRSFLVSESPTSYDAMLYGFVSSLLYPPFDSPLEQRARSSYNLSTFAKRIESVLAEKKTRLEG
ncbi:GST N-terminal domain-containing protein [Azospirillaceae bacterium]